MTSSSASQPESSGAGDKLSKAIEAIRRHWIISGMALTSIVIGFVYALLFHVPPITNYFWPPPPYSLLVVLPHANAIARNSQPPSSVAGDLSVAVDLWDGIASHLSPEADGSGILKINNDLSVRVIPVSDGPEAADTISRLPDHDSHRFQIQIPGSGGGSRSVESECLLILGHESSTLARGVWRDYYKYAKIPVILLGPTNPSLTYDDHFTGADVFLRLLPNDEKQVDTIRALLAYRHSRHSTSVEAMRRTILVVTDRDNPVYSRFISTALLGPPRDTTQQPDRLGSATFCGTVEASATSSLFYDIHQIESIRPNTIVFVGMSGAAKALVLGLERQWNVAAEVLVATDQAEGAQEDAKRFVSWISGVELIFTDGCASSGFREFMMETRRSPWSALYVITTAQFKAGKPFDFEDVGRAAIIMAQILLKETASKKRSITASAVLETAKGRRNTDDQSVPIRLWDGEKDLVGSLSSPTFDSYGDNQADAWAWRVRRKLLGDHDFTDFTEYRENLPRRKSTAD